MDELQALIEQEKAIIKQEEQAQLPDVAKGTELIDRGIDAAVVHKIQTDENVQKKMLNTADKMIDHKLTEAKAKTEKAQKEAVFEDNRDACDLYGIDETTVPTWVVKAAKAVHGFWYIIWLIVGFFTTAPIVFLAKKIKVVLQKTWIAVMFSLLIYLLVLFSPILINYIEIFKGGM